MASLKGWWNSLEVVDLDQDGDLDIVAGNLGLNSKLKASADQPVVMYYNDFDDNQVNEQLLVYQKNGQEHLFATKDELMKQMPFLKNKYLKYADYAAADLREIFPESKFNGALKLEATEFRSGIFYNEGGSFKFEPLPVEAQFSPVYAIETMDFNQDGSPDLIGGGNFYDVNIQFGRYDASFGFLLENDGTGKFRTVSPTTSGLNLQGQVRDIQPLKIQNQMVWLVAKNNDSLQVITTGKQAGELLVKNR
jgi:hypothetical protein